MPCDTVQSITIDLSKVNRQIMASVLHDEGISESAVADYIRMGQLTVRRGDASESELKQKYAKKILQKAKDFGWSIKQNADGSFMLQKASF